MSKSKEYEMAIKIAGEVEKSFTNSMNLTRRQLQQIARQAALTAQSSQSMVSQFNSGVDAVSGGFGKLESFAKGTFDAMVKASETAAVAIGAVATAAVSFGAPFEAQMSTVKALTGATEEEFETLNELAKEIGETTSFSATEAGQAMEYMAMAGWKTEDVIGGISGIMDLAAASGEELASVSDIVTDALTAFGLSAADAGHFSDVLAAASTNSNTNVAMMGETFQYAAPLAGALGYSVEDTAVAIGLMANSGIKASAAGTALRKIFAQTTNGATVTAKAFGEMDIATQNSDGSMRELHEIMVDLRNAFSQMTESERSMNAESIAGKTAMSGLLAIVNASEADFNKLSTAMNNCEGAAANMADIKLDNLQGDVTLFKSAMEGVGIEIYEQFNGPLREGVQTGSEFLGMLNAYLKNSGAVQKVSSNIVKALPTFIRQAKSAGSAAMELMEPLIGIAEFMIDHPDVIAAGLAAIGAAIGTYKVAEGIKSVLNAFSGLSVVMTNPVALGIVAVATALAGVAAIITTVKLKEKELKEENLAEHFGSITLSLEDLERAARHIVGAESLEKLDEMLSNREGLEEYKTTLQSVAQELNKLNWKVQIGMELDEAEQTDYIANIDSYVAQCLDFVEQKHYVASLQLDILTEDNEIGNRIKASTKILYEGLEAEMAGLGEDLKEAVNSAFEDGLLEPNESEIIVNLQSKLAKIQNELSETDYTASLEALKIKYGGSMNAESFQNLQVELAEVVEQKKETSYTALQDLLQEEALKMSHGIIDATVYNQNVTELQSNYWKQIAEAELESANFQYETIVQQYADELENLLPEMEEKATNVLETLKENVETYGIYEAKSILSDAETLRAMMGIDEIDKTTVQALNDLFTQLEPTFEKMLETRKKMNEAGMKLPEGYAEGISNYAALGTIAESTSAMYEFAGEVAAESQELSAWIQQVDENGTEVVDALMTPIRNCDAKAAEAAGELYNKTSTYVKTNFAQGIDAETTINLKFKTNMQTNGSIPGTNVPYPNSVGAYVPTNGTLRTNGSIPGTNIPYPETAHALGGIFNTPHVALFAEEGPEAVIPINNTENAYNLWRQTGELLGVMGTGGTENAYNNWQQSSDLMGVKNDLELSEAAVTTIEQSTNNTSSPQINYSPHNEYHFYGAVDREEIAGAEKINQEEFEEMMEKYLRDKERVRL